MNWHRWFLLGLVILRFCRADGLTNLQCIDGAYFLERQLCTWAIEGHERWDNGADSWFMYRVEA